VSTYMTVDMRLSRAYNNLKASTTEMGTSGNVINAIGKLIEYSVNSLIPVVNSGVTIDDSTEVLLIFEMFKNMTIDEIDSHVFNLRDVISIIEQNLKRNGCYITYMECYDIYMVRIWYSAI